MAEFGNFKPSFITGANAKIKIGGNTLAYAVNVSYGISVETIPIETLGRYEVVTHEPTGYYVGGSLAIVRYNAKAVAESNNSVVDGADSGNQTETWVTGHFNPAKLLASKTVDIEVYQKMDGVGDVETIKILNCRLTSKGGGITKRGHLIEAYSFVGVLAEDGKADGNGFDGEMARTPIDIDLTKTNA